MSEKRVAYMHTINNEPAYFSERDGQLVYAPRGGSRNAAILASSPRQIQREQQKTIANRRKWGFDAPPDKYNYVRVELPHAR